MKEKIAVEQIKENERVDFLLGFIVGCGCCCWLKARALREMRMMVRR